MWNHTQQSCWFHIKRYTTLLRRLASLSMISGFRREVDEICALLGNYAASNGNSVPTFRDKV